jgi:multiple sugar transport system substrate-binding protein
MGIDRSHPVPLYFQIKAHVIEQILGGEYTPGGRLPTEHQLCERFRVSRTPVNRALSELAAEGVILRHRKRGSFVNPHWERRSPQSCELRVVVPDGPWEALARDVAPEGMALNVATVGLDNLHDVVVRMVAEGRAPDLALIDSVWVPEMAAIDFLWRLEDLDVEGPEHSFAADVLDPLNDVNRYRGGTYGVHAEADVAGLWYRRDHLDELGLAPPQTWHQLVGVAESVRAARGGHRPIAMPGGARAGEATTYCLLALLASNGAQMLDVGGITLDDSRTVQTLRFLRQLVEHGLMLSDVVAFDHGRPVRLLASGHTTFAFGGSYELASLAEFADTTLAGAWDQFAFVPVPAGPAGRPAVLAGGMAYVIFRQAAQPKAAMEFLKHLLSDEPLAALAHRTGQIPPRRSAVAHVASAIPFVAETAAMLRHASVRPATVEHVRVSAQLQSMLTAVLTGQLGPASATERAAELLGAITGLPVVHRDVRSDARPDFRPAPDGGNGYS